MTNAPEKIYIDDPMGEFDDHWSICPNNNSIEYTRTDALIDKACAWLEPVLKDLAGYNCAGDLIDDFKKAMKGE